MREIVQIPNVCGSQPIFEGKHLKVADISGTDWKGIEGPNGYDLKVTREEWEHARQWINDNPQWTDEEFISGFQDDIKLVMTDIDFFRTKDFCSISLGVGDNRFWMGFGTGIRFGKKHAETLKEHLINSKNVMEQQ